MFIIRRKSDDRYYAALTWVNNRIDAMKFDTRREAERRVRLLGDDAEVIEMENRYWFEPVKKLTTVFPDASVFLVRVALLLALATSLQAQTFTPSTIPSLANSSGLMSSTETSVGEFQSLASGKLRGWVADLVVSQGDEVCTVLSNGDGTFQAPECFAQVTGLVGVAVDDVNKDGYLDVLALGSNGVTVFLGDNSGTFSSSTQLSLGAPTVKPSAPILAAVSTISVNDTLQLATLSSDGLSIGDKAVASDIVKPNSMIVGTFTTSGLQDVVVLHASGLSIFLQTSTKATSSTGVHAYDIVANPSTGLSITANINSSVTSQIQISNNGNDLSNFSATVSGGNGEWTVPSQGCPSVLAGGSSCFLPVSFAPVAIETTSNATLQLFGVDVAAGNVVHTLSVPLLGTESSFENPTLSTTVLNFNSQLVNTTSAAQTITLTNDGNESLTPTVSTAAPFSQTNNCSVLASLASCSVSVTFTPTTIGSQNGTLTFSFLETSAKTAALSGVGAGVPAITTQPAPQTVFFGQSATFSVSATGSTPLSYAWTKNGVSIGSNSSTLTFTPVATDNGASIQCVVSNSFGSATSSSVLLTVVNTPQITTQVANQTVNAGQSATFSVTATGAPTLSYAWMLNGQPVGANSATFTTAPTTSAQNGATVVVVVSNSFGTATSQATLTVNFPPTITTPVANQSVVVGNPVTFSVVASGTAPLTYAWIVGGSSVGSNSNTLTFAPTANQNGDTVQVTVSNSLGSVTSSAILTVQTKPVIVTQPSSTSAILGQSATFSVVVQGSTPLTYAWTLGGAAAGTNSPTFTTPPVTAVNNGQTVQVTVSNSAGSVVSSPATLTVNFPPSITTQPSNQSVVLGNAATFTVVASGTNDSYQWMRGSTAIAGATSASYSFTPVALDSGATFSVVVSNAYGPSVTSNSATLTVNIPPSVDANQTVLIALGTSATLNVTATGTGPLTYQWMNSAGIITGVTSASYTTPGLTANATFSVTVSSPYGSATKTFSVLVFSVTTSVSPASQIISTGTTQTITVWALTGLNGVPISFTWTLNGAALYSSQGVSSQNFTIPNTGLTCPLQAGASLPTPCAISTYTIASPGLPASDANGNISILVGYPGGSQTVIFGIQLGTPPPPPPVLTINMTNKTASVTAGQTVDLPATVTDTTGNAATVSCTVAPATTDVTCTPSVTAVSSGTTQGNGTSSISFAVATTTSAARMIPAFPRWQWGIGAILTALLTFACRPRYRLWRLALASCILACIGCGGGSTTTTAPPPPPPQTATYTITGTVTAPGFSQSASATVTVTK